MKRLSTTLTICFVFFCAGETALCGRAESRIATRVDTVTVIAKGRNLLIRVQGMGRTPGHFAQHGRLLRRNQEQGLNKEGLLEYDLMFNPQAGYSGFNLRRVIASITEKSVPQGVKGVRVFGEYNHYDGSLPESKKRKSLVPSFRRHREKENPETSGSITEPSPSP
jgi:hypothetical protein